MPVCTAGVWCQDTLSRPSPMRQRIKGCTNWATKALDRTCFNLLEFWYKNQTYGLYYININNNIISNIRFIS